MRIPLIIVLIPCLLQPQNQAYVFKQITLVATASLLVLLLSKSTNAQNIDVQRVSISAGASICTNDTATLNIYLGGVNFTYDSIAADVSGDTLNIQLYYTGSSICYGAITYPSDSVEIPPTNYGSHIVIVKSYKSFTLLDTYTTTTNFASCDPISEF